MALLPDDVLSKKMGLRLPALQEQLLSVTTPETLSGRDNCSRSLQSLSPVCPLLQLVKELCPMSTALHVLAVTAVQPGAEWCGVVQVRESWKNPKHRCDDLKAPQSTKP